MAGEIRLAGRTTSQATASGRTRPGRYIYASLAKDELLCENPGSLKFANETWKSRRGYVTLAELAGRLLTATLDLSQCPDGFVAEITARGENISKASAPWLGLKFMVHCKDPEMGIDCYPDIAFHPTGMFPDTTLRLVDAFPGRVRQNPKLHVGLQGCSGRAVFDLSSLRLFKSKPTFPRVNEDYRVAYPAGMASPGSLRGFMTPHRPNFP